MISEWLKVMLEEITRKKSAAAEAQAEVERRGGAPDGPTPDGPATDGAAADGPAADGPAADGAAADGAATAETSVARGPPRGRPAGR